MTDKPKRIMPIHVLKELVYLRSVMEETHRAIEELTTDAEWYWDERSDKWKESVAGEKYNAEARTYEVAWMQIGRALDSVMDAYDMVKALHANGVKIRRCKGCSGYGRNGTSRWCNHKPDDYCPMVIEVEDGQVYWQPKYWEELSDDN